MNNITFLSEYPAAGINAQKAVDFTDLHCMEMIKIIFSVSLKGAIFIDWSL